MARSDQILPLAFGTLITCTHACVKRHPFGFATALEFTIIGAYADCPSAEEQSFAASGFAQVMPPAAVLASGVPYRGFAHRCNKVSAERSSPAPCSDERWGKGDAFRGNHLITHPLCKRRKIDVRGRGYPQLLHNWNETLQYCREKTVTLELCSATDQDIHPQ